MPTSVTGAAGAPRLTLERIFAAPDLSGASLRSPLLSPDGRLVAYLRGKESNKDRLELWAYDIAQGGHRLLVDPASLLAEEPRLSPEEEQRRERQRTSALSGILDYQFSPDSRFILVPLGGELYLHDLQAPTPEATRQLTSSGSPVTDARFSPHGSFVSFIRDQNLRVLELGTGAEQAITLDGGGPVTYGTAELIAQEEMDRDTGYWWSPDEQSIAFTRVDESPVQEVQRLEIDADAVKVVRQRYPAAGFPNASVQLWVARVAAPGSPVQVDLGSAELYLARVTWLPDSTRLAVQRQSRDQATLTLLAADARTGATHELLTEHSETWVELHDELTFLERSPRFIWASSSSGFKHLSLHDLDGHLIRPLTSGPWEVTGDARERAIRGVDEQRGLVYFMAGVGSPLERHLCRVSLEDPDLPLERLTTDPGWHSATMPRDASVFLDTFSTPEQPPSLALRNSQGELLQTLVPNALTPDHPYTPYLAAHLPTELGSLEASDGQKLYYRMIRPRDLTPGRRYPVIVDVYGGPGVQRVRRVWGASEGFYRQYLAQRGYIVFTLDNRGTAARGTSFTAPIHRHLGQVEVEDQVTGVRFLQSLPFVDAQRIGVLGWSYGGYMALRCVLKAPELFAAAVAGAPVTDWALYDTHYTERYLGTPLDNPDGYRESSILTHAGRLRRPLLILHGMADDNVLFTHSTALFKVLQDLNKPFEMMTYPGAKHGLLRHPATGLHAYATLTAFFDRVLAGA